MIRLDPDVDSVLFFPLVGVALVVVLVLLARSGAWKHWRRRRRGACLQCGYDLRGELDSGCPECGWRRDAASS